jgi:hypothetical protein
MRAGLFALIVLATACRVTTTERILEPQPVAIARGAAARTWDVVAAGGPIGRVVLFEAEERPGGPVFVVQDVLGHDLGMVDALGRAWRYRPHQREAEWLGTGTVAQGAGWILSAEECQLEEVPLGAAREAALAR